MTTGMELAGGGEGTERPQLHSHLLHLISSAKKAKNHLKLESFFSALLYAVCGIFIATNFYVLMNRNDTIYYLRLYHLTVGALMISCGAVMLLFMWQAHKQAFPKLKAPYTIPRPTLISAFVLTAGIALGYAYFLVFNIAFSNCDKLIDAAGADEQWQEAIYSALMILFCLLALAYILQRSYYGSFHDSRIDILTRRWVNIVLTIVWVKIVIFKGYLSYQELCQRKELSGYWCPIIKRPYACDPETQLAGTQKIWYYLHKGLLNSTVISCASEFFPVMLVAHWLACGRAEEHADAIIRKRQEKKSLRKMLQGLMVYGLIDHPKSHMPPLEVAKWMKIALVIASWLGVLTSIMRWFVGFYFAMRFDHLHKIRSMHDDYWEFIAAVGQLILFSLAYKWCRSVDEKRCEPHHKAEARGDLMIIFGSAAFMSVKLLLQILELNFQRVDGFILIEECVIRTISLTLIQISEWLQFLCLGRVTSLHFEDIHATRAFLPSLALCSVIINWVGFGVTFFETNLIKYQLGKPEFDFSQTTLISMIFTQTIYPADYLFMFTAAGCWTDVLVRYMEMGFFQLGQPCLANMETDSAHNGHTPDDRQRLSTVESYSGLASNHHISYSQYGIGAACNDRQHHSSETEGRKRTSEGLVPIVGIAICPA